jgi:hypothetical protein
VGLCNTVNSGFSLCHKLLHIGVPFITVFLGIWHCKFRRYSFFISSKFNCSLPVKVDVSVTIYFHLRAMVYSEAINLRYSPVLESCKVEWFSGVIARWWFIAKGEAILDIILALMHLTFYIEFPS